MNFDLDTSFEISRTLILAASFLSVLAICFELILVTNAYFAGKKREAMSMAGTFALVVIALLSLFALVPVIRSSGKANQELPRHPKPTVSSGQRGFFMLEAMIFMAVILILMAMSVPPILQMTANLQQKNAIAALREIGRQNQFYSQMYGNGFASPQTLATGNTAQATCNAPGMLFGGFGTSSQYQGYTITWTGISTAPNGPGCALPGFLAYRMTATPAPNSPSHRYFYLDSTTGVVRYSDGSPATAASPILNY